MTRIRRLGVVEYTDALDRMRAFNDTRQADTEDEIWVLEHPPVFTRGVSCNLMPRENPGAIPVVDTDRGGQITYHGPGQLICYLMLDIKRRRCGIRRLVNGIEQCIIDTLAEYGISSRRKEGAPGVYVDGRKVAALGLRVRGGCTYHGLSLNLRDELAPFDWIDPCGYQGLRTVSVDQLVDEWDEESLIAALTTRLAHLVDDETVSES